MCDADKYMNNAATTAQLIHAGIELMRQNIKRCHPTSTEAQIEAMLSAWLCRTDDPFPGDTAGAVRVREQTPFPKVH